MLKDFITIVIPCKNENINIYNCIGLIAKQNNIQDTCIIIADNSDEKDSIYWLNRCVEDFNYTLKIFIIKGGYPAAARLYGSEYVSTRYILFLDSDVMLKNNRILFESFENIFAYQLDLLTVPFETEIGWNWIFRIFDLVQLLGKKFNSPFAVGGFQLWNTKAYWNTGGYVKSQKFAEDYWVSSKCDPKKFMILRIGGVWTSARRFKKKGFLYMFKIMIKSYINRNNPSYFDLEHNYWT